MVARNGVDGTGRGTCLVPVTDQYLSPRLGSSTTPRPAQGRHAVRQFSGLNRPARRCLYLRFAVRLATYHARLKVIIESLLLFCRALSSPTTCRFIPAHSHPCVALSSYQAPPFYGNGP